MPSTQIVLDRASTVAPIDRRLFGVFVEHMGRGVYGGIYEPDHATANEDGFRMDVVELVRELGPSTVRYPGGNFVSGFRWEDSVGPRAERPVRRDLAWHNLEPNHVGMDEMARWVALTQTELMLAINLGTRGLSEALDLLDYTNHPSGTALSDQRVANGAAEPHNIRMWCLGNEMDGHWQIGHMSARDYGDLAARTAAAMKMADKTLELVACGSAGAPMPLFGEWDRIVLERTYDYVEFISAHAYYQERGGDLGSFLATASDMQYSIDTIVATADHVGLTKKSEKKLSISFDEWNIWYVDNFHESNDVNDQWRVAPAQLEDVYTVADGVVVGSLLMTLLKNHDRVRAASLAQLVNVIAPIMTQTGGPAWRQTIFFPFATTSRLAVGEVLRPHVSTGTYTTEKHGTADIVDAVATFDDVSGKVALFLLNRGLTSTESVTISLRDLPVSRVDEAWGLHDDDHYAKNTFDDQGRVGLKHNQSAIFQDGMLTVNLPPVSWTAISLS